MVKEWPSQSQDLDPVEDFLTWSPFNLTEPEQVCKEERRKIAMSRCEKPDWDPSTQAQCTKGDLKRVNTYTVTYFTLYIFNQSTLICRILLSLAHKWVLFFCTFFVLYIFFCIFTIYKSNKSWKHPRRWLLSTGSVYMCLKERQLIRTKA